MYDFSSIVLYFINLHFYTIIFLEIDNENLFWICGFFYIINRNYIFYE